MKLYFQKMETLKTENIEAIYDYIINTRRNQQNDPNIIHDLELHTVKKPIEDLNAEKNPDGLNTVTALKADIQEREDHFQTQRQIYRYKNHQLKEEKNNSNLRIITLNANLEIQKQTFIFHRRPI